MAAIFISYRADDAKAWALLLRDRLAAAFGETAVFLDRDGLGAGDWRAQLHAALADCRVVLLLIGPHWLRSRDAQGRRLDAAEDMHREEIELALARPGLLLIPLTVDGAAMPSAAELPDSIRALAQRQALPLSDRSAHREQDLVQLLGELERATGLYRRAPAPPPRRLGAWLRRGSIGVAAGVALLVLAELGMGWQLGAGERWLIMLGAVGLTLLWRLR